MRPSLEGPHSGWTKLRKLTRMRVHEAALWILGLWWLYGIVAGYNVDPAKNQEFNPAVQEAKLQAWDRIHRMNAVLENRSAIEKWLFGYEEPVVLGRQTYDALEKLSQQNHLDERGMTAMNMLALKWEFAVVSETSGGHPLVVSPSHMREWREWEKSIVAGSATWWETSWLVRIAQARGLHDLDDEFAAEQVKNNTMYRNTLIASGASYLFFFAGLALLPLGIRRLRQCLRAERVSKVVRYSGRISLSFLGLLLLVTEQLNNAWFSEVSTWNEQWYGVWWWETGIDTLWRVLPVLVILGILYRKPAWVARSFELFRRPQWSMILALYALLLLMDFVIFAIMDNYGNIDPTEHVDAMEHGWMGLVYGLISACIMAPVAEEFLFRGLLFRGMLHKCGFVIAAGFSSLVFAVSHFYDVYGTISVGLFGLAAAVLYLSTRSLTNAIILHAIYNLTITVPTWMLFHSPL